MTPLGEAIARGIAPDGGLYVPQEFPHFTARHFEDDSGLAMRFPRFTGRWRDDKSPEDATTTRELVELFLGAKRTAAS